MEHKYAKNSSQIKHNLSMLNPIQMLKTFPFMVKFNMLILFTPKPPKGYPVFGA